MSPSVLDRENDFDDFEPDRVAPYLEDEEDEDEDDFYEDEDDEE